MPQSTNQPTDQPGSSQPDQPLSNQPALPLVPPSVTLAEQQAGAESLLATQPSDADTTALPTLPEVAPPYEAESIDRGPGEPYQQQSKGATGDLTNPVPLEAETWGGSGGVPRKTAAVTAPLDEAQLAEATALPPTAPPTAPLAELPPLARETMVADRYAVTNVVESHPTGTPTFNLYRVIDEKSYEECWVCGSKNNTAGELYCSDCGAQLTNKVYALREQPASGAEGERGESLLYAKGFAQTQGLPRIYKTFRDSQRDYALLEEASGQPLATFAPVTPAGERVSEERLLAWTRSLASALAPLHEGGVALANISIASINIAGGELPRIVDVSGAQEADAVGIAADVAALARLAAAFLTSPLTEGKTPTSSDPATLSDLLAEAIGGRYKDADDFAEALDHYREEGQTPATLSLLLAAGTHVGMVRKLNEDSLLTLDFSAVETDHHQLVSLLVVADGMGGHDSGEVASSMAVRTIAANIAENVLGGAIFNYGNGLDVPPLGPGDVDIMQGSEAVGEMLRSAVIAANREIVQKSRERYSDMGTTCVACLIVGNQAYFANVGDSRAYIYRNGKLEQVTEDHSLAWKLVQAGQLTVDEIRTFNRRNEIYKSLGDDPNMEVDLFSRKLKPFDVVLLCSDGLWEMIYEEDKDGTPGIATLINTSDDPHHAVQRLIKAANEGGGQDNIAVIIGQLLVNGDEED